MRIVFKTLIAASMLAAATPALAQEVIVTGQRRDAGNVGGVYNTGIVALSRPIVNLRRTADFAVLTVALVGDDRDAKKRRADLNATLRNTIAAAAKGGFELATGDYLLEPLTLANYETLTYGNDGRADTDRTYFLVKLRLTPGMDILTAQKRLEAFVASVSKVGRSSMTGGGAVTLSVVNPDQYRAQIIELIAADAAASAAKFGPGYGVAVSGLDRPVEWARAGPTEVFLYLTTSYTVRRD